MLHEWVVYLLLFSPQLLLMQVVKNQVLLFKAPSGGSQAEDAYVQVSLCVNSIPSMVLDICVPNACNDAMFLLN
jgi:hypothetical protein